MIVFAPAITSSRSTARSLDSGTIALSGSFQTLPHGRVGMQSWALDWPKNAYSAIPEIAMDNNCRGFIARLALARRHLQTIYLVELLALRRPAHFFPERNHAT